MAFQDWETVTIDEYPKSRAWHRTCRYRRVKGTDRAEFESAIFLDSKFLAFAVDDPVTTEIIYKDAVGRELKP